MELKGEHEGGSITFVQTVPFHIILEEPRIQVILNIHAHIEIVKRTLVVAMALNETILQLKIFVSVDWNLDPRLMLVMMNGIQLSNDDEIQSLVSQDEQLTLDLVPGEGEQETDWGVFVRYTDSNGRLTKEEITLGHYATSDGVLEYFSPIVGVPSQQLILYNEVVRLPYEWGEYVASYLIFEGCFLSVERANTDEVEGEITVTVQAFGQPAQMTITLRVPNATTRDLSTALKERHPEMFNPRFSISFFKKENQALIPNDTRLDQLNLHRDTVLTAIAESQGGTKH